MKSKKKRDYIKILKISIIVVVILGIVSIILGNYKDYTEVKLSKNNKTIFSIADLKVDDLKYGDMEKDIKKKIGKPEKEKKIARAEQVHHIQELKEHPELALDNDNLISLCVRCHNIRHGRVPHKFKRKKKLVSRERW